MIQFLKAKRYHVNIVLALIAVGIEVFYSICGRKTLVIASMATSLMLFSIVFEGSVTPTYAEEFLVPSFGSGKTKVRLYTDYFCPPCRAMEPDLEPVIKDLVKRNVVHLTFVDTPVYKDSPLYAKYFLYAMNEKKDLDYALAVRKILVEGSKEKIGEQGKLESFLKEKGIRLKPFDVKPTFDVLTGYMKEDRIRSTPTCVIEKDGKSDRISEGPEIINALKCLQ